MAEEGFNQSRRWKLRELPSVLLRWLWLGLAIWCAFEGRAQSPYQLKAAVMVSVAKFVQWPPDTFTSPGVALRIGIFGEDPFGADLEKIVEPVTINGRKIAVLRSDKARELSSCQIVFFSAREMGRFEAAQKELSGKAVLLVGEHPAFLDAGGMVNLEIEDRKVRFEVNLDAAERAGLQINAQLLRLASKVRRGQGGKK